MSAPKDLLDRLADARPRRLDPDHPGPGVAGIMTHAPGYRTARRVRRRLVIGLVPTAAVVAAAAVALALAGPGAHRPQPQHPAAKPPATSAAPQNARELFLVAAGQTEKAAAASGRFWVQDVERGSTSEVGPASRPYEIMRKNVMQQWQPVRAGLGGVLYDRSLGAAPATGADEAAWKADGSPARWTQTDMDGQHPIVIEAAPEPTMSMPRSMPSGFVFAGTQMTMAQFAALPTDPAALRRHLQTLHLKVYGSKPDDYTLFILGEQLVADLPTPPGVRAAAYRMMADLDTAKSLGEVTDQRGRRGIAVVIFRRGDGGWAQRRLIIDPATGRTLADESWFYGSGKQPAKTGKLMDYTLVLDTHYTNDNPPA